MGWVKFLIEVCHGVQETRKSVSGKGEACRPRNPGKASRLVSGRQDAAAVDRQENRVIAGQRVSRPGRRRPDQNQVGRPEPRSVWSQPE